MATALPAIPNNSPPARVQLGGAAAMQQTIEDLNTIRSFVRSEMKENLDFGAIPGTGGKPTLLQPGAQKILMYFNAYPDFEVEPHDLDSGHVEYIVKTKLYSRTSQTLIGTGIGSASTMESKYRWRKGSRSCPKCNNSESIIKGREEFGGGWLCYAKKGGCGAKFGDNDPAITSQNVNRVENPDIHDQRNTVLKMAKKRSLVDSVHGLGCMSELFTQDLEDFHEMPAPAESAPSHRDVPPESHDYDDYAGRMPSQARASSTEDRGSHQPARQQSSGHTGAPRTGRALFAWVKEQEQQSGMPLVKYINSFMKLQEMPARMVDLDESQVSLVHAEAIRKLKAVQPVEVDAIEATEAGSRG